MPCRVSSRHIVQRSRVQMEGCWIERYTGNFTGKLSVESHIPCNTTSQQAQVQPPHHSHPKQLQMHLLPLKEMSLWIGNQDLLVQNTTALSTSVECRALFLNHIGTKDQRTQFLQMRKIRTSDRESSMLFEQHATGLRSPADNGRLCGRFLSLFSSFSSPCL